MVVCQFSVILGVGVCFVSTVFVLGSDWGCSQKSTTYRTFTRIVLIPAFAHSLRPLSAPHFPCRMAHPPHQAQTIILPLSDHDEPETRGGSHWALLVYHRGCGWGLYDPIGAGDVMRRRADTVALRLSKAFRLDPPPVSSERCARQTNAYDCGVYVVAFAHAVASAVAAGGTPHDAEVDTISANDAKTWRRQLRNAVDELSRANEGAPARDGDAMS